MKLDLAKSRQRCIARITKVLNKDVCYRFKNLGTKDYSWIYELDRSSLEVHFDEMHLSLLNEHSELLFYAINYRWTQMLEGLIIPLGFQPKLEGILLTSWINAKHDRWFIPNK